MKYVLFNIFKYLSLIFIGALAGFFLSGYLQYQDVQLCDPKITVYGLDSVDCVQSSAHDIQMHNEYARLFKFTLALIFASFAIYVFTDYRIFQRLLK